MTATDTVKLCGLAAVTGLVAVVIGALALKALKQPTGRRPGGGGGPSPR